MKLVINRCFGGFGLSSEAEAQVLMRSGAGNIDDVARTSLALVAVVEEMQKEGKNPSSNYAELAVVEIPDNIAYTIEDYDGMEWVAEKHRTWR